MTEPRKLKRVVIKEELVALTGKVEHAIVLNQFIYWSERVRDVDKYLKEEIERIRKFSDGSIESEDDIKESLTNGWIYKTAAEMKEECMFEKSETTMERILKALVDKGWLDRRRNPKYKWDKTYQYRVNIGKIQRDLLQLGYALEGYSLGVEDTNLQNEASTLQNEDSRLQNEGAIPKTTTEITFKEISSSSSEDRNSIDEELKTKYPAAPFAEVKEELLNDETAVINTDKQYRSLLEYRLNNWKPKQSKPRKGKATGRKPIRTEKIPEYMEDGYIPTKPTEEEQAKKRQEIEEMMKQLRS